jgi:hypothetical protein
MQHRTILNVALRAHLDAVDVGAQHAAKPETGLLAKTGLAEQDGARRHVGRGGHNGLPQVKQKSLQ